MGDAVSQTARATGKLGRVHGQVAIDGLASDIPAFLAPLEALGWLDAQQT
jgi:hypothetical protein